MKPTQSVMQTLFQKPGPDVPLRGAHLDRKHVGPILDRLNARGIRPILWHDMMVDWDDDALRALAPRCDLMV